MTVRIAEVVVVGAGILGASIAHRLAEGGSRVTVVEAHRPAGGASHATFAWVNAVGKQPRAYFELNLVGMAEHRRLVDELGGGEWFHPGGNLEWTTKADELAAKVAGLRDRGYEAELMDPTAAQALEPGVALDGATAAAVYPRDAWVDPAVLVHRLLERAGVRLVVPAEVVGMETVGGRFAGVRLDGGARVAADAVVLCAGPRSSEIARMTGFELPMRPSPGLLAVTEPVAAGVGHILHAPGVAARPDGAGRILLASDSLDRSIQPAGGATSIPEALRELLDLGRAVIPRLAGAGIEAWRVGRRALTADGLPALGPVPGRDGAYLAVAHSGITLGPLIGRLVADELTGADPDPMLEPYRPNRFIGGQA